MDSSQNAARRKRTVIIHPEHGVYLGCSMGFGFWSKLDCAGQAATITFEDDKDALEHVRQMKARDDLGEGLGFARVECESEYADAWDLDRAGLSGHLGGLADTAPTSGMSC